MLLYISLLVTVFLYTKLNALLLSPPLSLITTLNASSAVSEASLNATNSPEICSKSFGFNFQQDSCQKAWQKIERSSHPQVFRRREGALTDDVPVPIRYLSDDGTCAVDVDLFPPGIAEATSDGLTISNFAGGILVQCVYQLDEGGTVYLPGNLLHPTAAFPSAHERSLSTRNISKVMFSCYVASLSALN